MLNLHRLKRVEEKYQVRINIYEQSKERVNVYGGGWQSRLNAFKEVVENAFVTPTSVVQVVPDALPAAAPDSQEGNGSEGYVCAEFDFDPVPDSPEAESEPK